MNKMLMCIGRRFFRSSSCLLRQFSIAPESTFAPEYQNCNEHDDFIDENKDFNRIRSEDCKSLNIAIIGLPNVGKSTLINRLTNRPVCATASRFHVTRAKSNAIYSEGKTQLVFIDTPGLVSAHEFKKFELENSFKDDVKAAMESADIVGVIQDVSNKYTRGLMHKKILGLMKMTRVGVPSILIMNKIDVMKKKRDLLALVKVLTSEKGWPNFSDVFMVSALTADGVEDLRNYFLDSAKPRDWEYGPEVVTDQPTEKIIERAVRAKFMDSLPNELPYRLKIEIEHLSTCEDGSLNCVVITRAESDRIAKIVLGKSGARVKMVARQAEEELSNAFRTTVRLKVAVHFSEEKK
ncbi:GTPase Era, mitochondrial [Venturia canescens]|uniref:GTPase Era, mitochondrial n=1 Tax=Venturia canescens TaxID=32260 RepID=UPI001C9D667B|nr:GTPase Era, mitochondrial [Venturia canescens]XP_043273825.1 GTPase Era, mitochondrial [Venturia canescens]